MTINMNDSHITSLTQLKEFAKLTQSAVFTKTNTKETYEWINESLTKFRYFRESKKGKSIVKRYICTMTGYSNTQIDRLIREKKLRGCIKVKERTQNIFTTHYTKEDIALLAEVDNAEGRRTSKAVKVTCSDMYHIFNDTRFERLAHISSSHIYNLREKEVYKTNTLTYTSTQSTGRNIGIRAKPYPEGKPGYIRVDSVHQGDFDKVKGVYHINLVDEVTQEEVVVTVEGISEYFLLSALENALLQFHVNIINFHSDNGSEYINKRVSSLLSKMLIEQTKSRARKTNDNALVEGKNYAVVRRQYGYAHIPKKYAKDMEDFNQKYLNPYLFFHRQCAYADDIVDERGKIKKVYKRYMTPCDNLISIKDVHMYLREGVTINSLRVEQRKVTHLASAKELREKRNQLFAKIHKDMLR
jgi:transposase InsO family protein